MRDERLPGFLSMLYIRWVGESVNGLLPTAQIGGDLVRAKLLMDHGVGKRTAAASVIVNLTLSVVSLVLFCLCGVLAFTAWIEPSSAAADNHAFPWLALALGLAVTVGLVVLQRRGAFEGLIKLLAVLVPAKDLSGALGGANRLDQAIRELYGRHRDLGISLSWALLGWFAGAGEIWLALYFLGHPVGWFEAFILESLIQAVRNGAFFVPGALGVQEAGSALIGVSFGLGPETGLALSLVKRVRELLLGIPGLLVWQLGTALRLLGRTRASASAAPTPERDHVRR